MKFLAREVVLVFVIAPAGSKLQVVLGAGSPVVLFSQLGEEGTQIDRVQLCRKLPGTFTLNPNKYLFICALLVPLLFFINNIFIAFHHYIFASSLGLFGLLDSSGVVNHTLFFFLNINLTNFPQLILDLPRSCVYRSSLSTLPFFSSVLRSLRLILTTSRDVFVPRKLDGGMLS